MVKSGGRGGTKRKIDKMEKIPKREYRATTFTKRCSGLHSKAAQLCLLTDAQIAILATPPSTHSNVSFFSFGHSSVDAVVNAYLTGQRLAPVREEESMEEDIGVCMARKELGLECWWEKESLARSKDPRELMDAMKAIERMLSRLRSGEFAIDHNDEDVIKSDETMAKNETLNLQAVCCVPGDDKIITEEQDEILAICDSFCAKEEDNNVNGLSGSLDVYDYQEMDVDELIDFTTYESSIFEGGVLDSTQEHQGSLLMKFEAAGAAHDVSTNPNPPISHVSEEGAEDVEAALVFQNKKAWDEAATEVSTMNPYHMIYDFKGVLEGLLEEEAFVFDNLQFSDYFN
ncbi:MADS-box transcription factor family protein [Raphanus sativus]|uniref:Agamous-like MADS-box protein AGL97 n=1 Tax=Raphanus sativus TaxID=3726 RepID=A0A6J0NFW4_RAPSA|nr:agamous-like MADS-box protein AGL97 [Raphanus sativus]KAJ4900747.1 MADS-box transcription factor family protein [Raphanus sativus]